MYLKLQILNLSTGTWHTNNHHPGAEGGKSLQIEEPRLVLNGAYDYLYILPNLAIDDVPIGKDDQANKIINKFGNVKKLSFKPKSHIEIGLKKQNIDLDTSIKLSGSRFVVLKNEMALLERALINFMLDTHTLEFKYSEIITEDSISPYETSWS